MFKSRSFYQNDHQYNNVFKRFFYFHQILYRSYVSAARGTPSPAPTYHQFLTPHPYTNPQLYQQYLRTEEYRQRMMFANPSLLLHAQQSPPQPNPLGKCCERSDFNFMPDYIS